LEPGFAIGADFALTIEFAKTPVRTAGVPDMLAGGRRIRRLVLTRRRGPALVEMKNTRRALLCRRGYDWRPFPAARVVNLNAVPG
jgi:hypothetical protein